MADQFSLDGFDEPAKPTDRLFFALLPDPAGTERVAALTQQLRTNHGVVAKPIPAERLHVTLHHVGDFLGLPSHIVTAASAAAGSLNTQAFDLSFDRVATFSGKPGRLPLVLRGDGDGVAGVAAFQSSLNTALGKAGVAKGSRASYTPHLTLLYSERPVAEQVIEPIAWLVQEFVLIRSLIDRGNYSVIGRWPLKA